MVSQIIKFTLVSVILLYFRRSYRFGVFRLSDFIVSLLVTPLLLVGWILPLMGYMWLTSNPTTTSITSIQSADIYFCTRLINSVILVPIFEELLCRVYLMNLLHDSRTNDGEKTVIDRILCTFDGLPDIQKITCFSLFSLIGTTLIFTLGHDISSYISAIIYFSLTNLLYWKTKSLWVCIFTHSFTNLGIALLVKYKELNFLWF